MANVYVIRNGGVTEPMTRVRCQDEDQELQQLLEKNPDLLPGDQIDPEDPRRWLLIKREMPVPDPNTGTGRWSIDFFFVDQDATPTFVECKRFADTRARREIVGQMLEYAADGHYYWTAEEMRNLAEASSKRRGLDLEEAVQQLNPTQEESPDAFFDRVQQNLREGQLRIVFFLEDSPMELRGVVDFLNKQLERSEVLLVEARQYTRDGVTVVAPTLFGYTEEARRVKRTVTVTTAGTRRKWDKDSFLADANMKLGSKDAQAIETLYEQAISMGYGINWGTGGTRGSFGIKLSRISPKTLLTVRSNGVLSLNLGWLNATEEVMRVRDRLQQFFASKVGLNVPADYERRYPEYPMSEWTSKVPTIIAALKELSKEFSEPVN